MKLRELCKLYDIEYNSKNPKLSKNKLEQLVILEQTSKQNYNIIRELTQEEKREMNNRVAMKPIVHDLIYATLSMVEGNTLCGSIKDYYELFALVNSNFKWLTYNTTNKKIEYMERNNINKNNVVIYKEFTQEVDKMYRRIIKETFEQLQNELLIYVNKHLMFVYKDNNGYYNSREASNDEIEMWLKVSKDILIKYGYNDYDSLSQNIKDKNKIKNEIVTELGRLNKNVSKLGIEYFYYEYEIILNREYLNFDFGDCNELKNKVNDLSIKKLSKSKQGVLKEYDAELLEDCINVLIKNPT